MISRLFTMSALACNVCYNYALDYSFLNKQVAISGPLSQLEMARKVCIYIYIYIYTYIMAMAKFSNNLITCCLKVWLSLGGATGRKLYSACVCTMTLEVDL